MSNQYTTSQVADMLNITNSKLYYAIRSMDLKIERDHKGERVFSDNDISILKQAIAIVENGGTYKQASRHLLQGEVIEVDHTPPKQFNEQNIKALARIISQEVSKDSEETSKKLLKELEELKQEVQSLKAELKQEKEQEPEQKGFFSKLFSKN